MAETKDKLVTAGGIKAVYKKIKEKYATKEYVDAAVDAVDVSEQLKDYAKSSDVAETYLSKSDANSTYAKSVDTDAVATVVGEINSKIPELEQAIQDNKGNTYDVNYDSESGLFSFYENPTYEGDEISSESTAKKAFTIKGGGGSGPATSTLTVTRIGESTQTVREGAEVIIGFTYSSLEDDGSENPIPGTAQWKRNGVTFETQEAKAGDNLINITDQLSLGTNNISVTVTDPAGSVLTRTWSISVIDVKITSTFDDSLTYTAGQPVTFRYTPIGTIEKVVHFVHNGEEIDTVTTTSSNLPMTYQIPAQGHGTYNLEVYITAQLGTSTIETDHLFFDIIFYDNKNETPVIAIGKQNYLTKQYNTVPLTYYIYTNAETATVMRKVYLDDTLVSSTSTTVTGNSDTWDFKPTEVGTYKLVLECGSATKEIIVEVEELGIDVGVAEGYVFDFNPVGYTNNDTENRLWKNGNVKMSVSDNFDWTNGGYQVDENGDTYFCVKAGTNAYFDYKLFASDAKQKGKNFKVIYKIENVRVVDTTFLTCAQGTNNTGIIMKPHNVYVNSSTQTLMTPVSEEDIIEYEFNITTDKSLIPMFMSYEDGVGSRAVIYKDEDDFTQNNPAIIQIGSTECDVRIYRMRAYDSALDNTNVLNNFIADARSAEEMIDRYTRNQIYNASGELTPESVAEACPGLRVITVEAPWLTTDKKEKVSGCKVSMTYKGLKGDSEETILYNNWSASGVTVVGQGTSSNAYKASGQNLDFDMKKATISLTQKSGDNTVSKIKLTDASVSTNYLNAKVNIASSENANNALLQKRYDRYLPYTSLAKENDDKVKNSMEFFNCVIFLKETDLDKAKQFNDTKVHFYAIGNIGDSKKTDSTRASDSKDVKEFCVEVQDVDRSLSTFPMLDEIISPEHMETKTTETIYSKKDDSTLEEIEIGTTIDTSKKFYDAEGEEISDLATVTEEVLIAAVTAEQALEADLFDESDTYGFRYGAKPCDESEAEGYADGNPLHDEQGRFFKSQADMNNFHANCEVFRDFYRFLVRDLTTNGKEDPAKVAAWKTEFTDWFIRDAALYYYIFTLRYTMVDNRAKNLFLHYGKCSDGKYRFDYWDYDNDTSLGIDNAGKLTMTYGVEDEDKDEFNNEYFRCSASTLFRRIAKYFPTEIQELYNRCDSNCWSSTHLINEFDRWQDQFPEELWRLDIERKYFRSYSTEASEATAYGGPGAIKLGDTGLGGNGYAPNSMYLADMMNGKKKYQRRQFERDQDKYMDSKFIGNHAMNDYINLRCKNPDGVTPNYTVHIIPYANMYLSLFSELKRENPIFHQRVEAGKEYTIKFAESTTVPDFLFIYTGSRIQSLGDLSECYVYVCNLGNADKMQYVKLGSDKPGYVNSALENFGVTSAPLLSSINVQNCPNLGSVDCSNLHHLTTFEAEGSGLKGISFSDGGELQTAHLPAITTLVMKNLDSLEDFSIANYENLTTLTLENINSINTYEIIKNSPELLRLRLIGANWPASYNIPNKDILDRMANMKGLDSSNHNTDQSVVTGYIWINGDMGTKEIESFEELWKGLDVDALNKQIQAKVLYKNYDGTILATQYVTFNTTTTPPEDLIPTKPSTNATDFTFIGWDYDFDDAIISDEVIITAQYSESPRKYTVTYKQTINGISQVLRTIENVEYGTYVNYNYAVDTGSYVTYDYPKYTDTDSSYNYYLFQGWDHDGYITEDTTINAVFESMNCQNTAVRTALIEKANNNFSELTPIELYSLLKLSKAGIVNNLIETKTNPNGIFGEGDTLSIHFGNDVDTEDAKEFSDLTFTGSGKAYDTKIALLDEEKDFTIAVDFMFNGNQSGATIASCYNSSEDIARGFRITYNSGTQVFWGTKYVTLNNRYNQRDIVVLSHKANSKTLNIYHSNLGGNDIETFTINYDQDNFAPYANTLLLGGLTSTSGIATGTVYWTKVWNGCFNSEMCSQLVQWPHEVLAFETVGFNKYYLTSQADETATLALLAKSALSRSRAYGDSANYDSESGVWKGTGNVWKNSHINQLLNTRLYNAIPLKWRVLLKQVRVPGLNSSNTDASTTMNHNYITLPSYLEMQNVSSMSYDLEVPLASTHSGVKYIYESNMTTQRIRTNSSGTAVHYWTRTPYLNSYNNDGSGYPYVSYVSNAGYLNSQFPTGGQYPCYMVPQIFI